MSYNLFLDDIRNPPMVASYIQPSALKNLYLELDWVIVRSYIEFVETIRKKGIPSLVSFDHDLSISHYSVPTTGESWDEYYSDDNRERTGYDCAFHLLAACVERNVDLPQCLVHSMNIVGRENIEALLKNFKKAQNETRN